ncbi:MAG: dihydrolipoyl dehydrogenase [Acidobacteriales bacterium]|nr:dihydrolipoyl dehydrogenase [Terriglobales bacterium]
MAETIYDVAIIGGGPGGYTAAIRAGQYGLKTLLIDKNDVLGGTCLNVGCIPTKALLFSAEVLDHCKHGKELGIDGVEGAKVNWKAVIDRKNKIVTKHNKGLDFLMKKNKVSVMQGTGRLIGPAKGGVHTVEVYVEGGGGAAGDTQPVKAKNIILATGSEARMLPGLQPDTRLLTNVEILSMTTLPKSLIVIGSGAVGSEFASIFNSFGAEVTVIEMLDRIVPVEDADVSKELHKRFVKRGIQCLVSTKVDKVEKTKDGVAVTFTGPDGKSTRREAEKVLIGIGRAPNTGNVGLEKTNIKLDRGFIPVNAQCETTEPGVYAIGDIVAGLPQLAHAAMMEGIVVVSKIAGKYAKPVTRNRVPGATYTDPEIGSVGLTEAQAKEKSQAVKVGKFPLVGNSKATIVGDHEGFVKVVADAKYGEILGVHIIGPKATELIAEAVTAMDAEMTVEEMMNVIHAHPTLYESLGDAWASVYGLQINV